jgi:hypothetical protein
MKTYIITCQVSAPETDSPSIVVYSFLEQLRYDKFASEVIVADSQTGDVLGIVSFPSANT